jgi:hypothetical protein
MMNSATKQSSLSFLALDCFAEPVIGRRFAPTRWLAMTFYQAGSQNTSSKRPRIDAQERRSACAL